jgi:proline racemase
MVSLIDTRLTGSFVQRTTIGEIPAIVTRIDGTAWITGDHEFMVCDDDPFRDGFRL